MTTEQLKQRLHAARIALSRAPCTCAPDRHDPYWMRCPGALAAAEHDAAITTLRQRLSAV